MGLKEIFTGGPRVTNAKNEKIRLLAKAEEKDGLKSSDKVKLDRARSVTRRHALRLVGGGTAVATGVAGAVAWILGRQTTTLPEVPAEKKSPKPRPDTHQNSPEMRTKKLIERAELGFVKFERRVRPLIAKISDPVLRAELERPFELFQNNTKNQSRNYVAFMRQMQELSEEESLELVQQSLVDPDRFTYSVMEDQFEEFQKPDASAIWTAATFDWQRRSLSLSENFDPESIFDVLVMYHELVHAAQDNRHRVQEGGKYVVAVTEENPPMDINTECGAYAQELEVLDLLMDGALRRSDPQEIVQKFRELGMEKYLAAGKLEITMLLAKFYFPAGMSHGKYPERFRNLLIKEYSFRGHTILKTPNVIGSLLTH